MPKVKRIAKARKAQGRCGKCGDELKVGDPYIKWSFRFGGTRKRCTKPECYPSRSDLTQNEILSALYDVQDGAGKLIDGAKGFDDLESLRDEFAEQIREVVELVAEKMENIESGFGHTDLPIYEEMEERRDGFEDYASEIESADFEEYDPEADLTRDEWLDEQRQVLQDAVDNSPD